MDAARSAFHHLGLSAEVTRTDWGIGLVLTVDQRYADALELLRRVRDQFSQSGLITDAALVTLDVMDDLHCLDRIDEIASEASAIITTFTEAGMVTSALTAFAYLQEASTVRTVTPQQIDHVRQFLYRAEREPLLLFALPPGE